MLNKPIAYLHKHLLYLHKYPTLILDNYGTDKTCPNPHKDGTQSLECTTPLHAFEGVHRNVSSFCEPHITYEYI